MCFVANMIEYIVWIHEERTDGMNKMHRIEQSTYLSTIAVAALVGGLAGAVAGLMLAPKSGKAIRQGIQLKADTVFERVGDVTTHRADTIKHQSADLIGKGKKLSDDLQTFIHESINDKRLDISKFRRSEEPEAIVTPDEFEPPVIED